MSISYSGMLLILQYQNHISRLENLLLYIDYNTCQIKTLMLICNIYSLPETIESLLYYRRRSICARFASF